MAVGATDYIDRLLVQKYAQQKVDNHEENAFESKVDPNDMLSAMNTCGYQSMNHMVLQDRLALVCYGAVAKAARYVSTNNAA